MPRPKSVIPAYRLHKQSGQAYVYLNGKQRLLGPHGSEESRANYAKLLAEAAAGAISDRSIPASPSQPTVGNLITAFWDHAKVYYSRVALDASGEPRRGADGLPIRESTEQLEHFRQVLIPLRFLYGETTTVDFGCLQLEAPREAFARPGEWVKADGTIVKHEPWCRNHINRMVGRIKRVFAFGVTRRMVPASVHAELCLLQGLRRGGTVAPETAKVRPVDEDKARAILPFASSTQVRTMIELQILTGMRSSEICIMRAADIDRSVKPWRYTPRHHKGQHLDLAKVVRLGKKARRLLRPFLKNRSLEAYLFSPTEADIERRAEARKNRKTKVQPSQVRRGELAAKRHRGHTPRQKYDRRSYYHAIRRACERAFAMPNDLKTQPDDTPAVKAEKKKNRSKWRKENCFFPHQLRHRFATDARKHGGIEAARIQLGHTDSATTEIYAEADEAKAAKLVERIG